MCGIAGFVVKENSRPLDREGLLTVLLQGIDNRGGDATGFVARNQTGQTEWHKASCDAGRFNLHRRGVPEGANVVLCHTRWATQGHQCFPENNHPIRRGSMYVIHNGVVTNDDELFAATGRERYGDVDSEAIAAVLSHAESLVSTDGVPGVRDALGSIGGSAAIAAMDDRDGTVLLARISGSPLCVLETRRLILFASTAGAIVDAHQAAVGSLGRKEGKVEAIQEGTAILIQDGRASRFTFTPKPSPVRTYVPTPSTTGSYIPGVSSYRGNNSLSRTLTTFGERWEWEDDKLVDTTKPTVVDSDRCELCGDYGKVWTVFDGHDDWELCDTCSGLTDTMPIGKVDNR